MILTPKELEGVLVYVDYAPLPILKSNATNEQKIIYANYIIPGLEVPLHNRLVSLVKKLLDIPDSHISSGAPLLKPMLYGGAAFVFRPPAFRVGHVFRKDGIDTQGPAGAATYQTTGG